MEDAKNEKISNNPGTNDYIRQLTETNPLREPTLRAAARALRLPAGSHGLDAGCGLGLQALLLAEEMGPSGHITGLDLSPEFITCAREIIGKAGLSGRISFEQGDISRLPFDTDTFDWAWSVDCAGYSPANQIPMLKELARVVKPGGTVAILAWTYQQLLPGYPLLEARLNTTSSGIAPFIHGKNPGRHFYRALGRFREVGLEDTRAHTFAGDAHAPLRDDIRTGLISILDMRWPGVKTELSPEDWAEFQRLCQPDSPDFIIDLPDYYAFFVYSMFSGKVPGTQK